MRAERVAGRYELGPKLGSGRGGLVHQATDSTTGARVAVKLRTQPIADDLDIERAGLRSLEHPHLVRVLDAGTDDGRDFIVTELVAEGSLEAWKKPLPAGALHELITQLLEGLAYLHGHGIVHGDVKTENILVASKDPPVFKLGDFGLARQSAAAALGGTLGSPAFMPPEIVRGEPADERSDLYALGVVFYECTFGALPFDDTDVRRVLMRHLTETPEHLTRPGSADPKLVGVLRALLSKEPAARPANARLALALWRGDAEAVPKWVPKRLGVLVGRDDEIEKIEKALAGREAAVSIGGIAGTGKTRLLRELALRAELRGTRSVWWTPYAVHGLDKSSFTEDAQSERTEHAPILTVEETKSVAERRARKLLSSLGSGPWLLLVDDMDLAPDWFVESLAFLLRDVASDAVSGRLVCIAGREKAAGILRDALEVAALPQQPTLELTPWSQDELREAAAALFGAHNVHPDLLQLLEAATGSVPAEVEAAGEQLARQGLLRLDTHGQLTVAADVTADKIASQRSTRIGAALANCNDQQLRLLRLTSLMRSPVTIPFLRAFGAHLAELVPLQRSGLLANLPASGEPRYSPAHEGIRQALLEGMSSAKKRSLHDRIAEILERSPDLLGVEQATLHRTHGSELLAARKAALELQESTSASRPEMIREAYEALLEIWPREVDPDERLDAEIKLLDALLLLGQYDLVYKVANVDLDKHPGLNRNQMLRNRVAEAHLAQGAVELAIAALQRAPKTGQSRVEADVLRAKAFFQAGSYEEVLQLCEVLLAGLEDSHQLADRVLDVRVLAMLQKGQHEKTRGLLLKAFDVHKLRGDPHRLAADMTHLGMLEFSQGKMKEAENYFQRANDLYERVGDRFGRLRSLNALGGVATETGRYSEARELLRRAFDLAQRLGHASSASLLGNLGLVLALQGRYREALEKVDLGRKLNEHLGIRIHEIRNRIVRGNILAALGLEQLCREELRPLLEPDVEDFYKAQVLLTWSDLALRRLDLDSARPWLHRAREILAARAARDEEILLHLLWSRLILAEGNETEAITVSRAALAKSLELGLLATQCDAKALLSEMLLHENPEESVELAIAGLRTAQDAGLLESVWRFERVLGRLAVGHDDPEGGLRHYQACVRVLGELSADLPSEYADSYLSHPDRIRVFEELAEVRASIQGC